MYYGNKAKVHIPNWWEIRKMCKGLDKLEPRVDLELEYDGSFRGIPSVNGRLHLVANESGVHIRHGDVDVRELTPQQDAKWIEWVRIRSRGYKPADQPEEKFIANFKWEDICGFSYDKSVDAGSNVTTTQRITATRVAVLGLFALAAPKTKKHYEYYDNGGEVTATLHTTSGDLGLRWGCRSADIARSVAKECRTFGKYVAKHAKAIPSQDQISHSVRL